MPILRKGSEIVLDYKTDRVKRGYETEVIASGIMCSLRIMPGHWSDDGEKE